MAVTHKVQKGICLSTDKAVPINAMGMSRHLMENYVASSWRLEAKYHCGTR